MTDVNNVFVLLTMDVYKNVDYVFFNQAKFCFIFSSMTFIRSFILGWPLPLSKNPLPLPLLPPTLLLLSRFFRGSDLKVCRVDCEYASRFSSRNEGDSTAWESSEVFCFLVGRASGILAFECLTGSSGWICAREGCRCGRGCSPDISTASCTSSLSPLELSWSLSSSS